MHPSAKAAQERKQARARRSSPIARSTPLQRRLSRISHLSLDAPLVAIAWQLLLARAFAISIETHQALIVASGVWLGYAADRWLDARKGRTRISSRHRFSKRWQWSLLTAWTSLLISALSLSLLTLEPAELRRGLALTALALGYTLVAQLGRKLCWHSAFKSIATASLVAASSALFLWPALMGSPASLLALASVWLLFLLNCLLIRTWEGPEKSSPLPASSKLAGAAALGLAALCLSRYPAISIASALSMACLIGLHSVRERLDGDSLRIGADLCLLTPFALMLLT